MGVWNGNEWEWSLRWRQMFECDKSPRDSLLLLIKTRPLNRRGRDSYQCQGGINSKYSIQSFLDKNNDFVYIRKPDEHVTNFKAPPGVELVTWFLARRKLKIVTMFYSLNLIPFEESLFSFCGEDLEIDNHLFFTYKISWLIWKETLNWWGLQIVTHENPIRNIESWSFFVEGKFKRDLWTSLFFNPDFPYSASQVTEKICPI